MSLSFPGSWNCRLLIVSTWLKSTFLSKCTLVSLICLYHYFSDHCIRAITSKSSVIKSSLPFIICCLKGIKGLQVPALLLMLLLNKNSRGFCNHIFTENFFVFTELRKSPLALSLSVNVTGGIQIKAFYNHW